MAHVAAGELDVPIQKGRPIGKAPGHRRRQVGAPHRRGFLARLDPAVHDVSHVGHRIAEGAELPVEEGGDPGVPPDEHVSQPVVAVHHADSDLLGHSGHQRLVDFFHGRELAGLGLLPLGSPALQLAGQIGLPAPEIAQADLVGVEPVQIGEHLDDGFPEPVALLFAEELRRGGSVSQDDALHVLHHVEGGVVDVLVLAESQRGRNRNLGPADGGDDPVLAGHVVGGGQHRAEGRAPEHVEPPGRVGELVGEVRVAAFDQLELERRGEAIDVGSEPLGDPIPLYPLDYGALARQRQPSFRGVRRPPAGDPIPREGCRNRGRSAIRTAGGSAFDA